MVRHVFKKLGMTSIFAEDTGEEKAVTVLRWQPAKVVRHEKLQDGRNLVVVEYDVGTRKKMQRGWVVADVSKYEVGAELTMPELVVGSRVSVTGTSKGRGFQDVVTRHGFAGGPAAHGSRFHRAPGSVGMRTEPGRTIKGKKLPGQDGNERVTIKNLKVAYCSNEEKLLAVEGGVPGARGGIVFI